MTYYNMYGLLLVELRRTVAGVLTLFTCLILANCATVQPTYFGLQFVDSETGRGVPLVEITTTNQVRYISDSAGRVALQPSDLASRSLFFSVSSNGYYIAEDKWGVQGINVILEPGEAQIVPMHRLNIAERLYRETGEGIYHDSQLLGAATPVPYETRPKGGVFGQDSVVNAIYGDQLYWFWGDTKQADSPFGNFKVSGAVSPLGKNSTYDPSNAIDFSYFVSQDEFVRPMCPIEGAGAVWISGVVVVAEKQQEQMLCGYVRVDNSMVRQEVGIAKWNDQKKIFEKLEELPLDAPLVLRGHPTRIVTDGEAWFYFGNSIPDVRVRANLHDLLDLKSYQGYTCLRTGSRWSDDTPPLDRDKQGNLVCDWKTDTDLITPSRWATLQEKGLIRANEGKYTLVDMETADPVIPHSGSISWNEYRKRWILVFGQAWGTNSFLGEVWYAEALHPEGPWSVARKIVTHDRYSFYNVKQHPYFAKGKYIYFEGTYTQTFSGNDLPTPRYDYNQIMYRLNLDDARLPHMMDFGRSKDQTHKQPVENQQQPSHTPK